MIGKTNCYIFSQMPKGTPLSELTEGTLVKANEVGAPVEFYLAKHDYEPGLNGDGRQLIVRKDCYDARAWDSGNINAYARSDIDSWFNSDYIGFLDPGIVSLIGTTKIRYTPGNGNTTVGTLERSVFGLSLTELGESTNYANVEGSTLPIANVLKIAYLNGTAHDQWTRSPNISFSTQVWGLFPDGSVLYGANCKNACGSRPCFTLPSDARVDDDLNIIVA